MKKLIEWCVHFTVCMVDLIKKEKKTILDACVETIWLISHVSRGSLLKQAKKILYTDKIDVTKSIYYADKKDFQAFLSYFYS
jgi:hypothetical protein